MPTKPSSAPPASTPSSSASTGEIGTIEVGKRADLVLVKGQPLDDISLLAEPDNVEMVIKDGSVVKDLVGRLALTGSHGSERRADGVEYAV